MSVAAAAADRQHPLTLVVAAALLGLSALTILTFSIERYEGATLLLAYTGGMAMLLTPCRFPIVLGIVPLCKRGHPARGIVLALLFGAGLTVTQTLWGIVIAAVGEVFGLREVARYLSLVGGAVAYAFGLSMLGLVSLPIPSGAAWQPWNMQNRSEYIGAFFMGLLLGNTGLCCPDPVFLSMVPFIAASGNLSDGAILAAAYGLGRATPLVAIVMLARGGVDALQLAVRHKRAFDRTLAWALLATGTFTIYGYSGVAYDRALAVALMLVPAVAYHIKIQSPLPRAAAWAAATVVGTLIGVRLMYWMLVNLP
jgi:cytochrome c-type biogenesis protein